MKTMFSRAAMLATFISVAALAACKGKDSGATTDTTAVAGMSKRDTAMSSGAVVAAPASLSDANIAALLIEVNIADSTLAVVALPKLTDAGARSFAKLMMGEHHALHNEGLAVDKAQKITPELPASDPFKPAVGAEQSALASQPKGAAYDSTYIAHEVGIHKAVIDWQDKNMPQDTGLLKYMKDAKSVYQKHLDEGLHVQTKLGGGPVS